VLTSAHEGRADACFAVYVLPCGLRLHRLLVCTSHENLTHELVERSGVVAVHLVPQGREEWVERFGFRSGRDVDKLADVEWRPGVTGAPIVAGALGYVEGRVIDSMDCGDHTARLVEPVAAELWDPDAVPLTMFDILRGGLDDPRVERPPG
jgi:flavin reductase (DIM6/NTAB) family NADH-FMN oxidoreductase RutF